MGADEDAMRHVDLYAARPAVKAEAACTPALVACVVDSPEARAAVTCRRLAPPLDACVCADVLSPAECAALRREAAAMGFSFWHEEGAEGGTARAFRNADTVEVTCPEVAAALWARLQPFATPLVELSPADAAADDGAACERGLDGTWRACGVNPVLLFSRYGPGGHFSPHTDGNTVVDLNNRSLHSVILYLNDCADGGETALFAPPADAPPGARRLFRRDDAQRLRWPPGWVADSAPPRRGSALLFAQHVAHEGAPVGPGCEKIIIRTDIMYRREPPVCDDDAGRTAYGLWRDAGAAEAAGDAAAAVALYRRCAKASPAFAQLMGLA